MGDSAAPPRCEELYFGLRCLRVGAEVNDRACPPREQAVLLLTSHSGVCCLEVLDIFESYALPLYILWLDCPGVVLAHVLQIPRTKWLGRRLLHLLHGGGEQGLRGDGNSIVSLWRTNGSQSTHIVKVDHSEL